MSSISHNTPFQILDYVTTNLWQTVLHHQSKQDVIVVAPDGDTGEHALQKNKQCLYMLVKNKPTYPNIHVCTRVQLWLNNPHHRSHRKNPRSADEIKGVAQEEGKRHEATLKTRALQMSTSSSKINILLLELTLQ